MDSGGESEEKFSSRDDEGKHGQIFLKKYCIVLCETLCSFGHPFVKHD